MCQIENSYDQVRMCVRDSIKGHGQVLNHAIVLVQVIKAHADCSKSLKFERENTVPLQHRKVVFSEINFHQ